MANEISEVKGSAFFIMYGESIKTLQDELVAILGVSLARSLLFRFGFKCGHMSAEEMGLIGQGRQQVIEYLNEIWIEMGLARPETIKENGSELTITLDETLESSHDGKGCDFTRGFLGGLMSSISGVSYHCKESECVSSGHKACVFQMSEQQP
jgi:predicted hydrocarbon binding protein